MYTSAHVVIHILRREEKYGGFSDESGSKSTQITRSPGKTSPLPGISPYEQPSGREEVVNVAWEVRWLIGTLSEVSLSSAVLDIVKLRKHEQDTVARPDEGGFQHQVAYQAKGQCGLSSRCIPVSIHLPSLLPLISALPTFLHNVSRQLLQRQLFHTCSEFSKPPLLPRCWGVVDASWMVWVDNDRAYVGGNAAEHQDMEQVSRARR